MFEYLLGTCSLLPNTLLFLKLDEIGEVLRFEPFSKDFVQGLLRGLLFIISGALGQIHFLFCGALSDVVSHFHVFKTRF